MGSRLTTAVYSELYISFRQRTTRGRRWATRTRGRRPTGTGGSRAQWRERNELSYQWRRWGVDQAGRNDQRLWHRYRRSIFRCSAWELDGNRGRYEREWAHSAPTWERSEYAAKTGWNGGAAGRSESVELRDGDEKSRRRRNRTENGSTKRENREEEKEKWNKKITKKILGRE